MSGVVEAAENQAAIAAYNSFLQELLDGDDVTGPAAGITKQVIDQGIDSLSQKQAFVFQTQVQNKFPQPACTQCGESIPWEEAYEHVHSPGRCSSCEYSYQKFMDER